MTDKRDEAQLLYCCAMYALLSLYAERNAESRLIGAIERKAFDPPANDFAGLFFDAATAGAAQEAICVEDFHTFFRCEEDWAAKVRALRDRFETSIVAALQAPDTRSLHLILSELLRGSAPRRLAGEVRYIGDPDRVPGVAKGDIGTVCNIHDDGVYVEFHYDDPWRWVGVKVQAEDLEQVSLAHLLQSASA